MDERRRFVRVEAPIALRYKVVGSSASGMVPKTKKDLSIEGVRVALAQRLASGTDIQLELFLPGEAAIRPTGKVVWSARFRSEGPYEAGVRFTEIDSMERDALARFIHSQLSDRSPFPDH